MSYPNDLNRLLDQATPVPDMPSARIHDHVMAAFPARRAFPVQWAALAATVVLGVGGFMAFQSYSTQKQALMADADAFAEQLVSEVY
jgi:hypothetical protein